MEPFQNLNFPIGSFYVVEDTQNNVLVNEQANVIIDLIDAYHHRVAHLGQQCAVHTATYLPCRLSLFLTHVW